MAKEELLAALVAMPGAVALVPDARLPPSLLDGPLPSVDGGPVVQAATSLLECQEAVRVPVSILWGDVTATRDGGADLVRTRAVDQVVALERLPIFGTVTETVPGGLLGLGDPVTREVTRVTGYDLVETIESRDLRLDIHVDWREEYIDWAGEALSVDLSLAAGLPFMAAGDGEPVRLCDGEAVLPAMPDFPNEGHDRWQVCIGCTDVDADARDGWTISVLGTRVSPHDAGATLDSAVEQGWSGCPQEAARAAERAADDHAEGVARGDIEVPLAPHVDVGRGAGEPAAQAAGATASPSTTVLGLAMAALSAGLAGVAAVLRRR